MGIPEAARAGAAVTAPTITKPDTKPAADETADEDTKPETPPTCCFIQQSTFQSCDQTAVAFIEFHKVNDCQSDDCNARGNMEGYVCQEHLDLFIQLAVDIIKEGKSNILPSFVGRCQMVCGTCRHPMSQASDILQKVTRL